MIRERILKKNDVEEATLKGNSMREKNQKYRMRLFSRGNGYELKKYRSADEFADVYLSLPYQFNLLADVLNAIV